MKKYLLLLLLPLFSFTPFDANVFKPGDLVNAWDPKGIMLRRDIGMMSMQLGMIPYGSSVTILKVNVTGRKLNATFGSANNQYNFTVKTDFVKVKYNNEIGYVSGGYLSKMPCFKKAPHGFEEEDGYLQRNYGTPKVTSKTYVKGKIKQTVTKRMYKNGFVTILSQADGCSDVKVRFPKGTSYHDAVLFEQSALFEADAANGIKITGGKNKPFTLIYNSCD